MPFISIEFQCTTGKIFLLAFWALFSVISGIFLLFDPDFKCGINPSFRFLIIKMFLSDDRNKQPNSYEKNILAPQTICFYSSESSL